MTDFDRRMAELQARFSADAARQAEALEQALDNRDMDSVRRIAHGLAGRAGMFGFDALGEVARRADEADDADLPQAAHALVAALGRIVQGR